MIIFEEILKLYSEINNIYHKMLQLEFENKVYEDEFLLLMNLLRKKINEEKNLFEQFINDYKEDYDWLLNLLEQQFLELEDYVVSRLNDYMSVHNQDKTFEEEVCEEEMMQRESMRRLDQLYRECSKNLYLIYLSFIGDYIKSDAFSLIKQALLGFKYFNAIVDHDMESVLVDNNFDVGKINYVDLNFMATGLGIDLILSEEIRYMVYEDAIRSSVIELLSFNDVDYTDEYKKANCINASCMLRAGLLLLSDDEVGYNMAVSEIYKLIDDLFNFYNGLSVDIIKSTIDCNDKDKSRVRKISSVPLND